MLLPTYILCRLDPVYLPLKKSCCDPRYLKIHMKSLISKRHLKTQFTLAFPGKWIQLFLCVLKQLFSHCSLSMLDAWDIWSYLRGHLGWREGRQGLLDMEGLTLAPTSLRASQFFIRIPYKIVFDEKFQSLK